MKFIRTAELISPRMMAHWMDGCLAWSRHSNTVSGAIVWICSAIEWIRWAIDEICGAFQWI